MRFVPRKAAIGGKGGEAPRPRTLRDRVDDTNMSVSTAGSEGICDQASVDHVQAVFTEVVHSEHFRVVTPARAAGKATASC